ncbi:DUF461 domain-containing protein [Streptomyces sp. HNM0574]|uniref:DUF461 domain-containing protein n=1 Tax=Streptomyces sp. HNM0574 TaxID=2714954 RepID=UPI00146DD540|nr:DUF461 domain-containing protein [Streptomyces sp. HNM0574]NLU68040.1 copper chaperone PCu(A)C [Streptomyces sp. HNM0574]
MSSSLRRGTLAATTLALAVVTLSACGAGNNAQTHGVNPDNAAKTQGSIKLQNVNIVTAKDGSENPANVSARIFNDSDKDEVLKGITVNGSEVKAKLSPAKGEKELTVPAGGSLMLGGENNASAMLGDAAKAGVADGNAQPVTFELSRTGSVELRATVVRGDRDDAGHYGKFGPTVKPSPEAPEGGADASGEPSEGAKGEHASPGAEESGAKTEESEAPAGH